MSRDLVLAERARSLVGIEGARKYVTMRVGDQMFGLEVNNVEDILLPQKITSIPLAPPEVMGVLNLRGRIVTAVDLRVKMSMGSVERGNDYRCVVVNYKGELFSLVVDRVYEVLDILPAEIARNPENLSEGWKNLSEGVFSFKKEIMVILSVEKIFGRVEE